MRAVNAVSNQKFVILFQWCLIHNITILDAVSINTVALIIFPLYFTVIVIQLVYHMLSFSLLLWHTAILVKL